jgi:muconate cycloisomerase
MRIASVEVIPVAVPLKGGFKNAHAVKTVQHSIVTRIETDAGLAGYGNVDPSPGYSEMTPAEVASALRESLIPAVMGLHPTNIVAVVRAMDQAVPACLDAKAAIEMACWDIHGKALMAPVHALLGGVVRQEVALNAWIGILDPADAAAEALEWCKRGFKSMKIKVGAGLEADRDRVAAVREAVADRMAIRIDCNEGYDVGTAIALAKTLAPYDITLFEQPVKRHDIDGLAAVRRAIPMPVMADEAVQAPDSLIRIIRKEAADIVKLKVMKQGGFYRTRQMMDIAEAAGLRVVIGHGFGLAVNTMAEVQIAATSANVLDAVECVGPLKLAEDIGVEPIDQVNGITRLPDAPGIGVEVDEARLEKFRVT